MIVLVVPLALCVTATVVVGLEVLVGAQVQNRFSEGPSNVCGFAQESTMSPELGQQVTVVMLATPEASSQ